MKKSHKINIDFEIDDNKSKMTRAMINQKIDDGTIKTVDLFNQKLTKLEEIECFFCGIKNDIKNIYYKIKYGFQRMFRGYDDVETFETFATFLERYTKILKHLRKWGNSYPIGFDSYDDWAKVLDEMINHFELSNEFHYSYKGMELNDADQIAYDHGNKALEMFIKYFWDLWD